MSEETPRAPQSRASRLSELLDKHSSFLSSFVLGLAGLVATSIWQYRQSRNAEVEAVTQRQLAITKADNDWRIARAEILAKNLDVLASTAPGAADRKYGVLLSLTRGRILDPELAVSYALELGRENAFYMKSVLANTGDKNYGQLVEAFTLTCVQRFGTARDIDLCKDDRLFERSDAIAELVRDELTSQDALGGDPRKGPMQLLANEDEVQSAPAKLAWLFEPYLQDRYEHRRWKELERFEAFSPGAKLVGSLVLATARTGELVSDQEAHQLADFHASHRKWLGGYLLGRSCDGDCRARVVEYMLSTIEESDGDFDQILMDVALRPRSEVARAVNQMHSRVLWCQMSGEDFALLRDRVVVPAMNGVLGIGQPRTPVDPAVRDDLMALLAMLTTPETPDARARFDRLLDTVKADSTLAKLYASRQLRTERQRANPPPMVKRVNFCGAPMPADDPSGP
jgi:hypothetical protein